MSKPNLGEGRDTDIIYVQVFAAKSYTYMSFFNDASTFFLLNKKFKYILYKKNYYFCKKKK